MRCPRCGCNDCCGAVYDQELVAVTADKDRLLSALRELTESIGSSYASEDDEVGACPVCGRVSYKECEEDCKLGMARKLVAELGTNRGNQ
jgi:hypothetical protein